MASSTKTFAEQLAFQELGEGSWTTLHPPQSMGNKQQIAYGGYALAAACKAACLSVPAGYHLYSFMGHFLGPATTDRALRATTRSIRQTRTFATRHVEVSQLQPDGTLRVCLSATADFMAKEQGSVLTYSRAPSRPYTRPDALPSTLDNARALLHAGKVDASTYAAFAASFAAMTGVFDVRPCPEGIFAQNLTGVAKALPHTQDALPLAARSTAEWFRVAAPLDAQADGLAALAFYCDGALSFCPLSFSHMFLDECGACSSLDFAMQIFGDGEVDLGAWHLREIRTRVGSAGRSFSECWVYDGRGRAVATMSQQSILRVLPAGPRL